MSIWTDKLRIIIVGISLSSGLLAASSLAYATEQSQQRQQGRDVRQDTRQESRETKVDCRAANQKNNAQCRQDKHSTKQGGRKQARDIKY